MSGAEVVTVAELDRRLRRAVEAATGAFWVEGEVTSLKQAASGHAYFCLKDEREDAVVDCVMYRFDAQRARKHLVEGHRLQIWGRATVWAPRGRLQLVGNFARAAGKGALLEALEALKQRLLAEGLFAPERKRALPTDPRVVGVVTSAHGAAFHDIRTVAFRRGHVRLVLAPAQVQGESAPESIIAALDLLERYPGLEVAIVGRGGGSGEDLAAFNDERVVRRLSRFRVPVVSAVGHEIDVTLTDLVADVRAATPSQAAELVVPDGRVRRDALVRLRLSLLRAVASRCELERARLGHLRASLGDPRFILIERQQDLDELRDRLARRVERLVQSERVHVGALERRLVGRHPRTVIARARAELGPLQVRLEAAQARRLGALSARLGERAGRLDALSPLTVLARGYAIATRADGRALRRAGEARVGDELEVRLGAGRLATTVTRVLDADSMTPVLDADRAAAPPAKPREAP
ncbi:MAG TPA: exodeoxyribonuclease VII large subunit [Polyangiaceae bacterium]|nr:exodeoxyribonuclease VII large subunit [Polyangiaceae bacterium]